MPRPPRRTARHRKQDLMLLMMVSHARAKRGHCGLHHPNNSATPLHSSRRRDARLWVDVPRQGLGQAASAGGLFAPQEQEKKRMMRIFAAGGWSLGVACAWWVGQRDRRPHRRVKYCSALLYLNLPQSKHMPIQALPNKTRGHQTWSKPAGARRRLFFGLDFLRALWFSAFLRRGFRHVSEP